MNIGEVAKSSSVSAKMIAACQGDHRPDCPILHGLPEAHS